MYGGQSNFEFEYLGEFITEFENILGYESGAQMGLIDEKNQRSKISCYCPFKKKTGCPKNTMNIVHHFADVKISSVLRTKA
jgi:hypothetical protein